MKMEHYSKLHLRIFIFIIFAGSLSSKIVKSSLQHKDDTFWREQARAARFHPFLMTEPPSDSEEDKICFEDIRTLQQGVLNQSLWAGLMVDATSSYPSGILHGSRYHLGNFDGCIAAAKRSPIGARYCLARLSSNHSSFLSKGKSSDDAFQDDFGEPDEMNPREVWMAVCVPRSCKERQVQQTMQRELQLWHTTITEVQIHHNLCTDADDSTATGVGIYRQVMMALVALAAVATMMDIRGGKLGYMRWILCWSIPRRWNDLIAPERRVKELPLQSLSALRIISILIIIGSHHGYHIAKRPLRNNVMKKEMYTDFLHAPLVHAYMFLWTILFISGLFLALKSHTSFFRSIFLRYLRLTPSYLAVIAFYALVLKSTGSGPLWKSIVHRESDGCIDFWWSNLLYLNNYIAPQPNSPGCVIQSWSLNVDMQLCILGTLLLIARTKWRRYGYVLFGIAFAFSMLGPFVTTLLGLRSPTWIFTESVLKDPWSAGAKMRRYVSTENWALPYLAGLCTGLFLEKSARAGRRLSHRFVWISVPIAIIIMVLLIKCTVHWSHPEVDKHSVSAAIFAFAAPGIWSICLVFLASSFALGPKTILVSVLCGKFFTVMGRLGYSLYLVHYGVQLANVGLIRAPIYATFFNMVVSTTQEFFSVLPICLFLYLMIEAPIREFSKDLFKSKSEEHNCLHANNNNNENKLKQPNKHFKAKFPKSE